ncbi:Hypp899 [Branchiostoma lanceolatum]|uniref:Hypp899 protein n=1 Tax=Branchiostoma lanceolatum TaxID=7740 RepID=A0A8J9V767_BRALA|nr:Hypp899 [Branchiostoma lanceolatum]
MRTSSALQEIERQQHLATCTHGTYSAIFPQARPRVVSYNVPKKNWIYYPNINRSYIIDKTYNPRIKTATDYYMPHRDLPREAPHHPLSAPAGKPRVTKATYPAYAANHKYIGQGRLEMDFNTSYTMAFNKPEGTFPARYTPTAHRDPLPRLGTYPPNPTQAWGQHVRNSKDYYESWPNTPSKAAFVGNTQEQLYQHSDQDFYRPGPLKPGQNDGRVAGKPYVQDRFTLWNGAGIGPAGRYGNWL